MSLIPRMVWRALGPRVAPRFLAAARAGAPWSVPLRIWRLLPVRLWSRLTYKLIEEAEEAARQLVQGSHPLSGLYSESDLRSVWAVTPLTLLILWRFLERSRPSCIVEFGSGISTMAFARYAQVCRERGCRKLPQVFSFDHDKRWLEQTERRLEGAALRDFASLKHAGLESCRLGRFSGMAYSPGAVTSALSGSRIDLCFIDGPTHETGRAGSLSVVVGFLNPGATILLDDAMRAGEAAAISMWLSWYADAMRDGRMILTARGLAVWRWD